MTVELRINPRPAAVGQGDLDRRGSLQRLCPRRAARPSAGMSAPWCSHGRRREHPNRQQCRFSSAAISQQPRSFWGCIYLVNIVWNQSIRWANT